MLPGFRILFALVVLSFAILIFGFGAVALLRTVHQNLASQPAWQPPLEIANARRNDRQPLPDETQTLAMLRVEQLPAAQSDLPPAQPKGQDTQSDKPAADTAAEASVPQPAPAIPAADTKDDDTRVNASTPVDVGAGSEKPADQTASSARPTSGPERAADAGGAPKVADIQSASIDQASPAVPAGPDASTTPTKPSDGIPAPERTDAAAATPAPDKQPPMKLAALPDGATTSAEVKHEARQQSARQSDAAELRAKRRARARLRARRLALARARAARVAQTQQTTNSSYYNSANNSGFTTTGSGTISATQNATPFGAPRGGS